MAKEEANYLRAERAMIEASDRSADTTTLAEAVKTTFHLSMNGGLSLAKRAQLDALGGKMRNQLRALLGEVFDSGTPALLDANEKIRSVNRQLDEAKTSLDRVADAIEGIGNLIASLDKLLSIVGVVA